MRFRRVRAGRASAPGGSSGRGWRRHFAGGVVCGILLVFVVGAGINRATVPDLVVRPLLMGDTTGTADAMVVMGAGVVGSCVPNINGVRRVLLAARLWRDKRAPVVIFTGASDTAECPVAVAMAALARTLGMPESSMRVETLSRSTRENAERTAPVLRDLGVRRVLIVTDRLHMRRAEAVFRHLGFETERASVPIFEGHPNNVSMLGAAGREVVALAWYRLGGHIGGDVPTERRTPLTTRSDAGPTAGEDANERESVMQIRVSHPSGPIVVLGASYAGSWNLKSVGGIPVVTKGTSGEQSFEMLQRFDRDVVALRPRAVIIWGFINDIFRAAPQDVDAALARVRSSYEQMIELSKRNGIEPILATEVTTRPKDGWSEMLASWAGAMLRKEAYQDQINRHVIATNQWLVDRARRERLLVLDLHGALAEPNGRRRRQYTKGDGSHITDAGYAALSAYAVPLLEIHMRQRPPAASPTLPR